MSEVSQGRQFLLPLAELIDSLCNLQIKEVLLGEEDRDDYVQEMEKIAQDIDLAAGEKQHMATGRLLRSIALISQANLVMWRLKDQMQEEPQRYDQLLERAAEVNLVRNHVSNQLMKLLGEYQPSLRKATFLHETTAGDESKWYGRWVREFDEPKGA